MIDLGELLIERAKSGVRLLAEFAQLCFYAGQSCLDRGQPQCVIPLVGTQRVDGRKHGAVVDL